MIFYIIYKKIKDKYGLLLFNKMNYIIYYIL